MAILATQDFDSLSESQTINTAALGGAPWAVVAPGTAPTAQGSSAAHGTRGAYIAPAASPTRIEWHDASATTATRVNSFYFRLLVDGGALTYLGSLSEGPSTTRADWRINADRTVTLRNAGTATGGASPEALAMNTWYRAEWMTSTGGQELRIYEGENTTPYITRSGTLTNNSHDRTSCGILATPNGHSLDIDTVRIADDWLTPYAPPGPAALISEPFEGGTNGANIATSNSTVVLTSGVVPTFTSTAIEGTLAAAFNPAGSYSQLQFAHDSVASAWYSMYLRIPALPEANSYIAAFYDGPGLGANKLGDVRINVNGTVSVRNNNTAVITSTVALTPNVWHRLAVRVTPNAANGLELKLYIGANRHGTTPDYVGTANSTRDFLVAYLYAGVTSASTMQLFVDHLQGSATAEPAPLAGDNQPQLNPYWLYDTGTEWVDVTPNIYYDNGAEWVDIHES